MGVPALIVAAGSGQRLGAGEPKALVRLDGRPLYAHSLEAFRAARRVGRIVVAVPPGLGKSFSGEGFETVDGGASRSESVANGLAHLTGGEPEAAAGGDAGPDRMLVVHDAARPLVTPALIDGAIAALESSPELDAVIAAAPVTDTIKRIDGHGRISVTLDRSELVSAQTPQVFRVRALASALATGDLAAATDDASLIEAGGGSVGVIDAPSGNIKVTTPDDLVLAARLLEELR